VRATVLPVFELRIEILYDRGWAHPSVLTTFNVADSPD
jgi:hypothetical protein